MNKEDYCVDEIVLHFEWDFFLWDSSFEANHLTLQFILSSLDANPALINEFVADDQLQDRINSVIARSRDTQLDEVEVCKLANQLRDCSSRLDVRERNSRRDSKSDIYYREFDFKRHLLIKEMEVVRRIAEIELGKV